MKPWFQTFTGVKFDIDDPTAHDIDIIDIAHSTGMLTRYNGHCAYFYSVAEHSCHVHDVVSERGGSYEERAKALLHDAAETYLGDIIRPVRLRIREVYDPMEVRLLDCIFDKWGLPHGLPMSVTLVDDAILRDEGAALYPNGCRDDWHLMWAGVGVEIQGWDPGKAKQEYLRRARVLGLA